MSHHALESEHSMHQVFSLSITLNIIFVIVESYYGWQANSLSLLADAAHNLSDVAALLIAWLGYQASYWAANSSKTYGWQRLSIMAALINASILLIGMFWMAFNAIERLTHPEEIDASVVIWVASLGILVNGISAYLLHRNSHNDLNLKGAFLHMLTDVFVSFGVVLSALMIHFFAWNWIDGLTSLIIALIIGIGSWQLLKQSWHLCLDGVPHHLCLSQVTTSIKSFQQVKKIEQLNLWALSTRKNALTAQLLCETNCNRDQLLEDIKKRLSDEFGLTQTTIELKSNNTN